MRRLVLALLFLAGCSSTDLGSVADCAAAVATCAGSFREAPAARSFTPDVESTATVAIVLEPACSWALLAPAASSTPKIVPPATVWLLDGGVCRVDPGP